MSLKVSSTLDPEQNLWNNGHYVALSRVSWVKVVLTQGNLACTSEILEKDINTVLKYLYVSRQLF